MQERVAILFITLLAGTAAPVQALDDQTTASRDVRDGLSERTAGIDPAEFSGGIRELTDGIDPTLIGFGTRTIRWGEQGPIDEPASSGPNSRLAPPPPPQFDMRAWMRGQLTIGGQPYTKTGPNHDYAFNPPRICVPNCAWYMRSGQTAASIYHLKTSNGDTWDINWYDANYIHGWITETGYGTPYNYSKFLYDHGPAITPRTANGGYPGEQIITLQSAGGGAGTSYSRYENCNYQPSQNLLNVIHQVWGPYENVYFGGNMGNLTVVKVTYFYACSGTTPATCARAETNWYTKEYGWVRWSDYQNDGSGMFVLKHDYRADSYTPGGASLFFPCFSIP